MVENQELKRNYFTILKLYLVSAISKLTLWIRLSIFSSKFSAVTNKMITEESKKSFAWSLKPLSFVTLFTAGVPLTFSYKTIYSARIRFLFLLFSSFIVVSHLVINGPRGIDKSKFDWMKRRQEHESPFIFLKKHPDIMLQFVIDSTKTIFFASVLLIHIIFIFMILWSQSWSCLIFTLENIKKEMNLDECFYRKCRKRCIIALLFLILVISKMRNFV